MATDHEKARSQVREPMSGDCEAARRSLCRDQMMVIGKNVDTLIWCVVWAVSRESDEHRVKRREGFEVPRCDPERRFEQMLRGLSERKNVNVEGEKGRMVNLRHKRHQLSRSKCLWFRATEYLLYIPQKPLAPLRWFVRPAAI